jgi:hypothetical protein
MSVFALDYQFQAYRYVVEKLYCHFPEDLCLHRTSAAYSGIIKSALVMVVV